MSALSTIIQHNPRCRQSRIHPAKIEVSTHRGINWLMVCLVFWRQMEITQVYSTRRSIRYSTRGQGQALSFSLVPALETVDSCLLPPAPKKKPRTLYSTGKLSRPLQPQPSDWAPVQTGCDQHVCFFAERRPAGALGGFVPRRPLPRRREEEGHRYVGRRHSSENHGETFSHLGNLLFPYVAASGIGLSEAFRG